MTERVILEPSPEHPVTVKPTEGQVTVYINGQQIAESTKALTLNESNYPAVQYIPMGDVDAGLLQKSSTTSYCPYKGDAEYFSVATESGNVEDVIWTYNAPFPAVALIGGHVAFYTDRAEVVLSAE
ncbi:DUF427 domain-containing protein [Rhodococcus fascians]|nr:DUF427 domain-containing protein [Rhodococcus fascians]MBY3999470.1 DUF427 domain-containing protein [Rhodococcus fascians]MBY4005003.1 DUF427 domain-containing protein [Rhodococcus fascians]MBY4010124.1 DUF427 domain-containing protein [Rhodococcus fascians]MBY4020210.1 DUF427 domain-containing protein [Rhodococcus fascians]